STRTPGTAPPPARRLPDPQSSWTRRFGRPARWWRWRRRPRRGESLSPRPSGGLRRGRPGQAWARGRGTRGLTPGPGSRRHTCESCRQPARPVVGRSRLAGQVFDLDLLKGEAHVFELERVAAGGVLSRVHLV